MSDTDEQPAGGGKTLSVADPSAGGTPAAGRAAAARAAATAAPAATSPSPADAGPDGTGPGGTGPGGTGPGGTGPDGTASAATRPAEPGPAGPGPAEGGRLAPRPPDRRNQQRWVPVTAGWLCLLIGLADIIEVVRPGLVYSTHLSKIHQFVPGTLTDVTHTVSVIIGLMLLMLSHGLKRRKRRAWEAVTLLLAVSVVVHVIPVRQDRIITAVVSALLVAALLYFRGEFYAVGDPRTRWRALWVFLGLVVK